MRDARTMSFRDRFLRRLKPPAAAMFAAPPWPVFRAPMPAPAAAAQSAIATVPAVEAPAPVVTAVPVLALAPRPVPVAITVAEPEAAIGRTKPSGAALAGSCTRVLVIASDRRFRTVAATLLTQRGYAVAVGGRGEDITELAVRERADVVIIDASASLTVAAREAARLGALRPRVEVVAVSDGSGHGLAALPVLPKWSSFEEVFEAIDRVRADGLRAGVTHVAR
jgi:hypothetical protein